MLDARGQRRTPDNVIVSLQLVEGLGVNRIRTSAAAACVLLVVSGALPSVRIAEAAELIDKDDFSETVDGYYIYWEKAYYRDLNIAGTGEVQIPFGIAHPSSYVAGGGTKYPLVLYLHGAGARGDNNAMLVRSTARFFAKSARSDPSLYNAFVLAPQVPLSGQWVNWPWGDGPYDQTDPGSPPTSDMTPVTSITLSGSLLTSVTVSGYVVNVADLYTGTSSGTPGSPSYPAENADNFNVLDLCASEYNPLDTVEFDGSTWSDTNGSFPDFFIFENGAARDSGTVRAIFPDDSLGDPVSFSSDDWGDTGTTTHVGGQPLTGMAFAVTALLDASGNPLTNSTAIKGIRIESSGIDPFCICAVKVSGPAVASFTLIDADADVPIPAFDPLNDGVTLDLAALPTRNLSIRANTSPSPVGSVRFGLDGNDNYSLENSTPYSLTGDSGGDYNPWTPSVGSHTVTATPYTESGGGGTAGAALTVTFDVIDGDGLLESATAASSTTYSEYMHLTENLLYFITDNSNDAILGSMLGIAADDIDTSRIYVVGDSMGAYGTWDILARQPALLAAGITSGGSGPKNKLAELLMTPIWAIHGELDTTVPNYLPHAGDPDGAGSLGMLGLIDPSFDGVNSTAMVYVDDPDPGDEPTPDKRLIYTGFSDMGHNPPAMGWTGITYGTREWLFAQSSAMPGDVDGNAVVDGLDMAAVISAWDTTPGDPLWNPDADLDGNGAVDGLDLAEVISNWSAASAAASLRVPGNPGTKEDTHETARCYSALDSRAGTARTRGHRGRARRYHGHR